MFLNTSLLGIPVTILSTRILTKLSLSSKVKYNTFMPANAQFTPKFAKNKLLPAPEPPAKMFSSPLLNPPNSFLSIAAHPVLTCPLLLFICSNLSLGFSK